MSPLMLKILMIGLPVLIGLAGIWLIVWLIITGVKESKNAKTAVNGLLFIHPDRGGGHALIDKHTKNCPARPNLRPIYYKPHWYSGEQPFWFFYEEKQENITAIEPEIFKCTCGYDAEKGRQQLHAHMMWNPNRKLDGKPIVREEWEKLHKRVEMEKKPAPVPMIAFVIKPYDIDINKGKDDVVITPFGVYDINNWECQKRFLTVRQSGLAKALQLGAGVIMAIACLVGIIALGGELGKKNAEPAKAAPQAHTEVILK